MSTRELAGLRELQLEVRAAAMAMTVHATRDDWRLRSGREGPDGWDWAWHRFDAAMTVLERVQSEEAP